MKDLDRSKIYSLEGVLQDRVKFRQLKDWLKKNDRGWHDFIRASLDSETAIGYNRALKEWFLVDREEDSICISTLFEDHLKPGTVIEVSNSGEKWVKRVLVMVKNDKAICWLGSETIEAAEEEVYTKTWNYFRRIQSKTVLTKQQIAKKFKLDVNLIEIKDE